MSTARLQLHHPRASASLASPATQGLRGFLSLLADVLDGKAARDLAQSTAATRPELAAALRRAARGNWV